MRLSNATREQPVSDLSLVVLGEVSIYVRGELLSVVSP